MDWDKLRAFAAAVEAGSLTAAGDRLGLSQSALSRKIAGLEKELGASLFHRHARGLEPTGPGRILMEAVTDVSARLNAAERRIRESGEKPVGELTVTAPAALGALWLTPRIRRFSDAYPEIDLRLILEDRELDLERLEADVAVRPWTPTQPDLIQRKLFKVSTHLYASQDYLQRYGAPATPADLDGLDLITLPQDTPKWMRLTDWSCQVGRPAREPRKPSLIISGMIGLLRAAESGLGVASLPDYLAETAPTLIRVLPDHDGPHFDVHLVYPEELKNSKRLNVFSQFMSEESRAWIQRATSSAL